MSLRSLIISNHRFLIISLSVLIMFSALIFINHKINSPAFSKVIDVKGINSQVYEDLKRIDNETGLQRKVYFYVHGNNKDEVSYVVFCGGNKYKNGYDVDIISLKDSKVIDIGRNSVLKFAFRIKESDITDVKYLEEFSSPIVVFKAKKIYYQGGELVRYTVNQKGEEIERDLRWVY